MVQNFQSINPQKAQPKRRIEIATSVIHIQECRREILLMLSEISIRKKNWEKKKRKIFGPLILYIIASLNSPRIIALKLLERPQPGQVWPVITVTKQGIGGSAFSGEKMPEYSIIPAIIPARMRLIRM